MMDCTDASKSDDITKLKMEAKLGGDFGKKEDNDLDSHRVVPADVRARLDMKFGIHRLFTLPMGMIKKYYKFSKEVVDSGIYASEDYKYICCQFCDFKLDVLDVDSIKDTPHDKCTGSNHDNDLPLQSDSNLRFQMQYECFRLYSLLKYPHWKVHPYELAKTGLYKSGFDSEDKCICHYCNIELCDWVDEDTAEGEHKRFAKELNRPCRLLSGEADLERNNIPIGREIEMSPNVQHDGIGKKHEGAKEFKPEDEKVSKEEMMRRIREFLMLLELVGMLNEMEEKEHEPKSPLQAIFIELRKVHGLVRPRRVYGLRVVMKDGEDLIFT